MLACRYKKDGIVDFLTAESLTPAALLEIPISFPQCRHLYLTRSSLITEDHLLQLKNKLPQVQLLLLGLYLTQQEISMELDRCRSNSTIKIFNKAASRDLTFAALEELPTIFPDAQRVELYDMPGMTVGVAATS